MATFSLRWVDLKNGRILTADDGSTWGRWIACEEGRGVVAYFERLNDKADADPSDPLLVVKTRAYIIEAGQHRNYAIHKAERNIELAAIELLSSQAHHASIDITTHTYPPTPPDDYEWRWFRNNCEEGWFLECAEAIPMCAGGVLWDAEADLWRAWVTVDRHFTEKTVLYGEFDDCLEAVESESEAGFVSRRPVVTYERVPSTSIRDEDLP